MPIRYRRFAPSISYVDIKSVRYRRSHCSISKVTNFRYRRSSTGMSISRFHAFDIERTLFDIAYWYRIRYRRSFSRSISKAMSQNIGVDIVYDITFTQCHSLQSGSSLCPGCITPAPKSLSAMSPGFLHPHFFAEFHSLIHRDLISELYKTYRIRYRDIRTRYLTRYSIQYGLR